MPLKLFCAAQPRDIHHLRHIQLLTRAGVEVHLVDDGVDFHPGCTPAAAHHRWPKSGRRTLGRLLGRLGEAIADLLVDFQLKRLWRREGAQLCHVHWIDERVLAAARAGLKPLVVTAYGSDLNTTRLPTYDPRRLQQVKAGLAQTDLLVVDSEDMIEIAEELAGRKLSTLLLPLGIDTSLFRPGYAEAAKAWRAELAIPAGAAVVLSPRVIKPNYRQVELARAFARAVHDHGLDGYMVFKAFGSSAAYVEAVREAAAELGVLDRVRLIEGVAYERLPVLYAMSDLAVSFPIMDAFPVTFLEAGACELPVLTHRLPAYASNGMVDFLNFMEGEDEAAIAAAIVRLCGDAAARERARAARRHVVEHFDEARFVAGLLGAYERLLVDRGRR